MVTASPRRNDAPTGDNAYATFTGYERLKPASFLVALTHALVLLTSDLFLIPSSLMLLATLASHAWHRRVAYLRVGHPQAVGDDTALWANFVHTRTVSVSGPCAALFLGTELVVELAA